MKIEHYSVGSSFMEMLKDKHSFRLGDPISESMSFDLNGTVLTLILTEEGFSYLTVIYAHKWKEMPEIREKAKGTINKVKLELHHACEPIGHMSQKTQEQRRTIFQIEDCSLQWPGDGTSSPPFSIAIPKRSLALALLEELQNHPYLYVTDFVKCTNTKQWNLIRQEFGLPPFTLHTS